MTRIAAGEEAAFRLLVERWERQVHAFHWRMTGSREEAEDLTQDTFLKVHAHAGGYRPEGRFQSWLFRIAGNLARSWARRRKIVGWVRFDLDRPRPRRTRARPRRGRRGRTAAATSPARAGGTAAAAEGGAGAEAVPRSEPTRHRRGDGRERGRGRVPAGQGPGDAAPGTRARTEEQADEPHRQTPDRLAGRRPRPDRPRGGRRALRSLRGLSPPTRAERGRLEPAGQSCRHRRRTARPGRGSRSPWPRQRRPAGAPAWLPLVLPRGRRGGVWSAASCWAAASPGSPTGVARILADDIIAGTLLSEAAAADLDGLLATAWNDPAQGGTR